MSVLTVLVLAVAASARARPDPGPASVTGGAYPAPRDPGSFPGSRNATAGGSKASAQVVGTPLGWGGFFTALYTASGYWCTGALIAPRAVLTAKHCTVGPTITYAAVGYADLTSPDGGAGVVRVTGVVRHPSPDVDLAIVVLADPVDGEPFALVPFGPLGLRDQQMLWTAGYSFTYNSPLGAPNDSIGKRLQYTFLPFNKPATCAARLGAIGDTRADVPRGKLCFGAAYSSEGICYGDSGSPILRSNADGSYTVAGVLNSAPDPYGEQCTGGYNSISFWQPVAPFRRWVNNHIAFLT